MPVYSRRLILLFIASSFATAGLAAAPAGGLASLFGSSRTPQQSGTITPSRFSVALAGSALNTVRRERGRPPLRQHGTLQHMAIAQAKLLAKLEKLSHTPGPGLSLKQRAQRAGYRGQVAENLAGGHETFEAAIKGWLHSSYHRPTLLSPRYTRFGAAVAVSPRGEDDRYGTYWAIILGN